MYLEDIARSIKSHVPADRLPDGDSDALFTGYAVLVRAKGLQVTHSDIHDAWAAWMIHRDNSHEALVAYCNLAPATQEEDHLFTHAVHATARELADVPEAFTDSPSILFPTGRPKDSSEMQQTFELYKMMVGSSEALVARRQGVNTFFLTINGALLTGSGLIVQNSGGSQFSAMGICVLAFAGSILCFAWRSLIVSFGQLNRGKFRVINAIEQCLKAAIYAAEWEALGKGEDPTIYRSFTSREIWVPNALLALHLLTAAAAISFLFGWIDVPTPPP